ncbi:hypothetical protein ACRAKI_18060 [Saccharothrix isguenensis]
MANIALPTVVNAFADPVRLRIVAEPARSGGIACGQFDVPVGMSNCLAPPESPP